MQIIQAQAVYENDEFEYELGLNPRLEHRPALHDRGRGHTILWAVQID